MNVRSRSSTGTSLEISLEEGTTRFSALRREDIYWSHLEERINENGLLELALLFFTFSTGVQEASVFLAFSCSASNPISNTEYLAIGATGLAPIALHYGVSGTCLSFFITGAYATGQAERMLGISRRRIWLVVSSLTQATLIWAAGVIYYTCAVDQGSPAVYIILSFLPFSSASQFVIIRGFSTFELTSMSTSTYVDLLADAKLHETSNSPRNYRFASLFSLFLGSFIRAYITKRANVGVAFFIAALAKLVSTAWFLVKKPTKDLKGTRTWHGSRN